jgi:peptidoglycan hydrolase CwlO-like protein
MTVMARLCRLLPLAALAAVLCGTAPAQAQDTLRDRAAQLRAAVAAEEARIADTREGLADANARLTKLNNRLSQRRTQLDETQDELVRTRVRLTKLEGKQATAEKQLSENLRQSYMDGKPNFVTVVLNADGFSDLVSRFEYVRRIARRNASVLGDTRDARVKVKGMTVELKALRGTYADLAKNAEDDRDQADALRTALLNREAAQLRRRNGSATQLASVQGRIAAIQRRQRAAARRVQAARTATNAAPKVSGGGNTSSPAAGGDVVGRIVAAANEIATTPYVYGGGHGGSSGGYDCSGSISYALAAAGLLDGSLDSTGFMSWGEAGPGKRVTIYANAGHAYMVVDGRRYDTSALSGGGTRWTSAMRSSAGFVARHPPGL